MDEEGLQVAGPALLDLRPPCRPLLPPLSVLRGHVAGNPLPAAASLPLAVCCLAAEPASPSHKKHTTAAAWLQNWRTEAAGGGGATRSLGAGWWEACVRRSYAVPTTSLSSLSRTHHTAFHTTSLCTELGSAVSLRPRGQGGKAFSAAAGPGGLSGDRLPAIPHIPFPCPTSWAEPGSGPAAGPHLAQATLGLLKGRCPPP